MTLDGLLFSAGGCRWGLFRSSIVIVPHVRTMLLMSCFSLINTICPGEGAHSRDVIFPIIGSKGKTALIL